MLDGGLLSLGDHGTWGQGLVQDPLGGHERDHRPPGVGQGPDAVTAMRSPEWVREAVEVMAALTWVAIVLWVCYQEALWLVGR